MTGYGPPEHQGSDAWEAVVGWLHDIARSHDLVQRALHGHAAWWENEERSDLPFAYDQVRVEFGTHSLTFKSDLSSDPYLKTTLDLYAGTHEVGYYALVTRLDGEIDSDDVVIYSPYRAGGAAVDLLLAEHQRPEQNGE